MFKALIVDDEPIARRVLREELSDFHDIEIIGEAADGAAALEDIANYSPDLVFLDLQMPTIGGLKVIARLNLARMPAIIAVTACDCCAKKALLAGAAGSVLKPVDPNRLWRALEQVLSASIAIT